MHDFLRFLDVSPTALHAACECARILKSSGFSELPGVLKPDQKLPLYGYRKHKGTIFAWRAPGHITDNTHLRIIASHTDSPGLKIKSGNIKNTEHPDIFFEVYGSPLLYTWFDRDLGIAGELHFTDGSSELIFIEENILRVSSLAIHLNRNVNSSGFQISHEKMLRSWPVSTDLFSILKNLHPNRTIIEAELFAVDLQKAELNHNKTTIHSDRLDNLAMVYTSLQSILQLNENENTFSVFAAFDHEEVGSGSDSGAESRKVMAEIEFIWNSLTTIPFTSALSNPQSVLLSADMAHAWHPSHPETYDTQHRVHINSGPVIKYNAKQRYATSGKEAALIRRLSQSCKIDLQSYYSNNDIPCGSTVGPILASGWGIPAIDMGNAMFSMHSIREVCGTSDIEMMTRLMTSFYKD